MPRRTHCRFRVTLAAAAGTAWMGAGVAGQASEIKPATFVHVEETIDVRAPVTVVFALAGNPVKDARWRSEVVRIQASGPLRRGTIYREYARVGFVPRYLTVTRASVVRPPYLFRAVAPKWRSRRFIVERRFKRLGRRLTRVRYSVFADTRIVDDISPLPVPYGLARARLREIMRSNLVRLKAILEGGRFGTADRDVQPDPLVRAN